MNTFQLQSLCSVTSKNEIIEFLDIVQDYSDLDHGNIENIKPNIRPHIQVLLTHIANIEKINTRLNKYINANTNRKLTDIHHQLEQNIKTIEEFRKMIRKFSIHILEVT